jgi:hypothetical protein
MQKSSDQSDFRLPSAGRDPLDDLLAQSREVPADPWFAARVCAIAQSAPASAGWGWFAWWQNRAVRLGAVMTILSAFVLLGMSLPGWEDSASLATSETSVMTWNEEEIFQDLDLLLADFQVESWLAFEQMSN